MEKNEIEKVHEELKYKIITLEDETDDSKLKKIIEDVIDQMNHAFEKFKSWYETNKDSEKAQEMKDKFLNEMNQAVEKTMKFVQDIQNNEELRQKLNDGKETVVEVSKKLIEGAESTMNTILENEKVSKVVDSVSDKVNNVIHDEKVQNGIKATKKGILNVATSAYEGLKNILTDKSEGEE